MREEIFVFIILGLAAAWGWLYFSGHGIMIQSEKRIFNDRSHLDCTYFHGTGTTKIVFRYSSVPALGKPFCPRVIDLQGD